MARLLVVVNVRAGEEDNNLRLRRGDILKIGSDTELKQARLSKKNWIDAGHSEPWAGAFAVFNITDITSGQIPEIQEMLEEAPLTDEQGEARDLRDRVVSYRAATGEDIPPGVTQADIDDAILVYNDWKANHRRRRHYFDLSSLVAALPQAKKDEYQNTGELTGEWAQFKPFKKVR